MLVKEEKKKSIVCNSSCQTVVFAPTPIDVQCGWPSSNTTSRDTKTRQETTSETL
jgi:peptide methionine sulfoxide reductase MsrB